MRPQIRTRTKTATTSRRQADHLRQQIAHLLHIAPSELTEWNTGICPDCRRDVHTTPRCALGGLEHLPPLFYALGPEDATGDRPLGMGANEAAALVDLLWNVKTNLLLADVRLAD